MGKAHPTRYIQVGQGFEVVPASLPASVTFEVAHVEEEPAEEVRLEEIPAVPETEEVTPRRRKPAEEPGKE